MFNKITKVYSNRVNRAAKRLIRGFFQSRLQFPIFRGYFDQVEFIEGEFRVAGWMISRFGPYDDYELSIDDQQWTDCEKVLRPDVAAVLNRFPKAEQCGFRFRLPLSENAINQYITIRVVGKIAGQTKAEMRTAYFKKMYEVLPLPPLNLIRRVDGENSQYFYVLKGAQNFAEILQLTAIKSLLPQKPHLLDWGCGCGRLAGFWLHYQLGIDLHGCDIDSEAVTWCRKNLPGGNFQAIPPYPPTPFEAGQFDLVIGFSVLTHLPREQQMAWLREMARIIRPKGILVVTTHGEIAAQTILNKPHYRRYHREGVLDSLLDTRLQDIAPERYYRAAFNTREYIMKHWQKDFQIIEYREQGASHYHDLIVLEKI